ncbi:hypothetical protein E8P77_12130 [Soehngenia saccharolytica]|nr:hypothetical protein [Tissierellales bacterium]TJX64512.1 hypothetical protein E8P77_12130 [Soehngenia saccharolytica]
MTATLRLISSEISGGVGAVKGVLIAAVSVYFPAAKSCSYSAFKRRKKRMRRRIGAWRQPENGNKKGMDELEAGWAAVLLLSPYHRNLWVINFCVVITLKKNMKKEQALILRLLLIVLEEHFRWRG